jgi:HSP20 family protein
MKIARFEPWPTIDLMSRSLKSPLLHNANDQWRPAVDIIEEKDRFLLRADVPGVDASDIDIAMEAGILTVSGVRHADEHSDDVGVQRAERTSGRFSRRFTMPETVDADTKTPKSRKGNLEVVIPKLPEVAARRITVEAA